MAWAQGAYKVAPVPLPSGSELPAALTAVLQPQGSQVLDAAGATVCEVWLGNAVNLQATSNSSPDVMYGNLAVGTLLGALHFPKAGSDFRGQAIKPGYYTLRYALNPQDGNHMGVNPTRDFALLSPAAQDTQVDKVLSFADLVKLSKQASGTNHPAILEMDPAGSGAAASIVQDSQGYTVLQAQTQGKTAAGQAQPLNLAIVVVGQAPPTE
ncbi:MAG: hypothetical protein ACYDA9_10015 [Terriglobia bacterium]